MTISSEHRADLDSSVAATPAASAGNESPPRALKPTGGLREMIDRIVWFLVSLAVMGGSLVIGAVLLVHWWSQR